jgi:MYXO-CTERM domain-containing protein
MGNLFTFRRAALGAALALSLATADVVADPCLHNPGDTVGNPIFGATIATFTGLGIDNTVTCIENGLWSDPSNFSLGHYVQGAEGLGGTSDPTTLSFNGATVDGTFAGNANNRDFFWVQDTSPNANLNGIAGSGPSHGIVWDLLGQANQVAVFVFVDHGPVPEEVLENTAWLSNDPNAADGGWTQASLTHIFGAGWSADPDIADGFVAVYQLPSHATFRFVSVTWGGPGAIQRDGDNEIDAVGGLTEQGGGVGRVPEPMSALLAAIGLVALGFARRRR